MFCEYSNKNARYFMGLGLLFLAASLGWQVFLPSHSRFADFSRGMFMGLSLVFNLFAATLYSRQRNCSRA